MAVIYDKAPKRKDFSGVVNKEEKENKDKTTTAHMLVTPCLTQWSNRM